MQHRAYRQRHDGDTGGNRPGQRFPAAVSQEHLRSLGSKPAGGGQQCNACSELGTSGLGQAVPHHLQAGRREPEADLHRAGEPATGTGFGRARLPQQLPVERRDRHTDPAWGLQLQLQRQRPDRQPALDGPGLGAVAGDPDQWAVVGVLGRRDEHSYIERSLPVPVRRICVRNLLSGDDDHRGRRRLRPDQPRHRHADRDMQRVHSAR